MDTQVATVRLKGNSLVLETTGLQKKETNTQECSTEALGNQLTRILP